MTDQRLSEPGATIAARLREARRGRGLSRRQLAEISKVSMRYLALLESGDGNVSVAILYRIAAALEMPPLEVTTGRLPQALPPLHCCYDCVSRARGCAHRTPPVVASPSPAASVGLAPLPLSCLAPPTLVAPPGFRW